MPPPGPWVQPADVERAASRTVLGANKPWTSSLVSADSTSSFSDLLATASFTINDEDPTVASLFTSYTSGPTHWTGFVTMLRPDPQFISLAPVAPPPTELTAPHVVGYEYEGGSGALGALASDLTVTSWLGIGGWTVAGPTGLENPANVVEYRVYEMTEGTDYSLVPTTVSGLPGEQVHSLIYPNQTVLGGRAVVATNHAGTFGLNNTPQSLATGVSFTTSSASPGVYAFADYHLYSGNDLLDASTQIAITPSVSITAMVRPPRYRLLYDVIPPLRQYPRDDGLVGTSVARQLSSATSRQASIRQRPVGYL